MPRQAGLEEVHLRLLLVLLVATVAKEIGPMLGRWLLCLPLLVTSRLDGPGGLAR